MALEKQTLLASFAFPAHTKEEVTSQILIT